MTKKEREMALNFVTTLAARRLYDEARWACDNTSASEGKYLRYYINEDVSKLLASHSLPVLVGDISHNPGKKEEYSIDIKLRKHAKSYWLSKRRRAKELYRKLLTEKFSSAKLDSYLEDFVVDLKS